MFFRFLRLLEKINGTSGATSTKMSNMDYEAVSGAIGRLDEGKGFTTSELAKISSVLDNALDAPPTIVPQEGQPAAVGSPRHGLQALLVEQAAAKSPHTQANDNEGAEMIGRTTCADPVVSPPLPAKHSGFQIIPRVVATSIGNSVLASHEQVLIKIVAAYYVNTQPVGYSLNGLRLIHGVTKIGKSELSAELITSITILKNAQLFEVALILARLLFPVNAHGTHDLLDAVHPNDCFNVVDELMIEYIDAHTVYMVVSNLAEGGSECIEPFMPFNTLGKDLWDTIEGLCSGGDPLDSIAIPVDPRPSSGKSIGFISRSLTFGPTAEKTASQPHTDKQQIVEEIVDVAGMAARNRSDRSSRVPEMTPRTLLDDGRPTGPPTVRSTVQFRDGAANNAAVVQNMATLEVKLTQMDNKLQDVVNMVQELTLKVTHVDEALNCLIVQHSQSGLLNVSRVNQSLFPSVDKNGRASPFSTTEKGESSTAAKPITYLISLLSTTPPEFDKLQDAIPDMKEALSRVGRNELASALCAATLKSANNRKRLITQLKGLP